MTSGSAQFREFRPGGVLSFNGECRAGHLRWERILLGKIAYQSSVTSVLSEIEIIVARLATGSVDVNCHLEDSRTSELDAIADFPTR